MMVVPSPAERLFVALDTIALDEAIRLADAVRGLVGGLKVGKEFFTAQGPAGVRRISEAGLPVFLDLKFHDIPATVAGAVRAALPLMPRILNVHASGGEAMLRAAVEAIEGAEPKPLLIAVSVLTSLAASDMAAIGVSAPIEDQARKLALLAKDCGLDGVVCSANEIAGLRVACGEDFVLVVPGIRPDWAQKNDQKRHMTPADALRLGADYLVVGRPVTRAEDPTEAVRRIIAEMER